MHCRISSIIVAAFLAAGPTLPADEVPQPEELFESLDADGNGTLSADEITPQQQPAFQRLLRVGDADEDGQLTRKEYLAGFQPDAPATLDEPARGPGARGSDRQRPGQPQQLDIGRLFDMADRDGDGKIALQDLPERIRPRLQPLFERLDKQELTREDFESYRRTQETRQPQPPFDLGRMFDRIDQDGDGKIAFEDLPEPMQQRWQAIFERAGKDELTREEFGRMSLQRDGRPQQPGRQPGAGDRPQMALMRLLDADGNGQLNRTELEQLAEKFSELDRNGDGQLDAGELFGFGERGRMRGGQRADDDPQRPRRPARPDGQTAPPDKS